MNRLVLSAFAGLRGRWRPLLQQSGTARMVFPGDKAGGFISGVYFRKFSISLQNCRNRQIGPTLVELNRRKDMIRLDETIRHGKEKVYRRSEFTDWNYSAELSAFSARIRESFEDTKLREAFLNPSYVQSELQRQKDLGMESNSLVIQTNERLAEVGLQLTRSVLVRYARAAFPLVPEEGVTAFVEYLTGLELLANTSFHIGTRDLIMAEEYPPLRETYVHTLLAIIGALAESHGESRAARFIIDVIGAQLHVQDINELWEIEDPMKTLSRLLANDGRGEAEARLLWVSGKETMMACYHIGIYSDKELIGQASGETAEIAEEMAARDALRRLFRTDDARIPIPLGDELDRLELKSEPNPNISQWSEKNIRNLVILES